MNLRGEMRKSRKVLGSGFAGSRFYIENKKSNENRVYFVLRFAKKKTFRMFHL